MSKAYSFSLQKVFNYRKRIEEKKSIELSNERMNLNKKMNEFNVLEDRKERAFLNQNNTKKEENIDLNNLKLGKDYIVQINNELTRQSKKVEDANVKVKQSREKLLVATKDKKMLEKLNDRKYEEYKKDKKLEQSKKDDDVSGRIAMYNKKKVSN